MRISRNVPYANAANTGEQKLLRGEGEGRHCRHAFSVQHRGDKFNTLNRCFIVDLSGARPRHWKSEFLAILQQMRCWMETFHHRNRRARRDVGQGNNSRTRCRSMRLIHSRRSRSRDDIAVSLAVPCGTQHHAVAFATTHEQRQRVRQRALDQFWKQHPERFVRGRPQAPSLPDQVWINRPKFPEQTSSTHTPHIANSQMKISQRY